MQIVSINVPIFKSEFTFTHGMPGEVFEKAPPDSDPLIAILAPVPIHPKRAEASTPEHRLAHYPKCAHCDVCNQARLYAKRGRHNRDEPSELPEAVSFGSQLAADHLIVHKSSSSGKEFVALVIRDTFTGVIQACPASAKGSDHVFDSLRICWSCTWEKSGYYCKE